MSTARAVPASLALLLLLAAPARSACPEGSAVADFAARDAQAQTMGQAPAPAPALSGWGPKPGTFPAPAVPQGCDTLFWKRQRILAVAEHYVGLPYRHHHVPTWEGPDGRGLDCSNFTAWVYNYGLGLRFTSNVRKQAEGPMAPGRRLAPGEPFAPGDLLFILKRDRSRVSHVVLYVDEATVIDSHGSGVALRPFKGWYRSHLSHARRVLD